MKIVKDYLQDNIKNILKLKEDGLLNKEIAKLYDTSPSSIARVLQANGYKRKCIDYSKSDEIIEKYKAGNTIVALAKEYFSSQQTISDILHKNNVAVRPAYKTTYSLNYGYFDNIDKPEKAYILGLLASDGNVFKNTISIGLQEDDVDILEKVREEMEIEKPLSYIDHSNIPNWKNMRVLTITNKHMAQRLKELGIVENKSLILEFPNCITNELLPHFLRGLMDGDGSLNKSRFRIGITGSKKLLLVIADKLNDILGLKFQIVEYKNKPCTIDIRLSSQNTCMTFLNYIYKDATIYMDRKYNMYQKYINKSFAA